MAGVAYLLDSNIILELLLDQQRADEVETFLASAPTEQLFLSDFSLHSLGVILFRQRKADTFMRAVVGDLLTNGVRVVSLAAGDYQLVRDSAERFGLDFDDAYQYSVAVKYGLRLEVISNMAGSC